MYNGIGLPTPRGSGTNGHVQRNLAYIKKTRQMKYDIVSQPDQNIDKPPNFELVMHQKKREIEAKCFRLRQELEAEGWRPDKIDREVNNYRMDKLEQLAQVKEDDHINKLKACFDIKDTVKATETEVVKQETEEKPVIVEKTIEDSLAEPREEEEEHKPKRKHRDRSRERRDSSRERKRSSRKRDRSSSSSSSSSESDRSPRERKRSHREQKRSSRERKRSSRERKESSKERKRSSRKERPRSKERSPKERKRSSREKRSRSRERVKSKEKYYDDDYYRKY